MDSSLDTASYNTADLCDGEDTLNIPVPSPAAPKPVQWGRQGLHNTSSSLLGGAARENTSFAGALNGTQSYNQTAGAMTPREWGSGSAAWSCNVDACVIQ
jgi:hypothetical protein